MATTRNSLLTALALSLSSFAGPVFLASAQTAPSAVPVPFTTVGAGIGNVATTVCSGAILSTDGSAFGDNCPAAQARLASPQGAGTDKYGNIYFADYNNKQVRVVYNGNPALAAAITAANSGYAISASRNAPAPTPIVGNVYTLAGVGANTTTFTTITATGNACANYAATGQPLGLNKYGDGCPGASAPVAARDVKADADGNLFIADYSNGRVRVFCVNCATTTLAAKLITLENPTVTAPVNGAIYTVAGFASGYRDAAIGYNTASNATAATAAQSIALLRLPTGVAISASDDVYIADNTNNAVRVLYNGGTVAKNILAAQGTASPVQGYVYTIAGAGCVSADITKTGSVSTANACLTTANSDTATLGNANGSSVVWSVYLDGNNNLFYSDAGNARVKMIYGGVAAPVTLPSTAYPTLQTGYTYTFAGQGTGTAGLQNGVAPSQLVLSSVQGVGGDAYGNVFFLDYNLGYLYEVYASNGIAALIGGGPGVTTPAAGATCNGLAGGPTMTDAFYNACPATQSKFTSPRGPVVADSLGNLYVGDAIAYYVRKFTYNPTFPSTTVNASSASQPYAFEFLSASAITSVGFSPSDFADGGSSTCTTALTIAVGAPGTTCVVNAIFTPKAPGARAGAITLNGATGVLGTTLFSGIGSGAALALDPAALTTTGTGYAPAGIAVSSTGSVYFTDATGKKVVRYTGTTATTVAAGFTNPTGIAVDNAGNVFVADATANTLTAIPTVGTQFIASSTLSGPRQVATDSLGRIYVADTGNNRIVMFGQGGTKNFAVLPFTGLAVPMGVVVDPAFNVYAVDSTHIVKLTPLGVQTTVLTQSGLTNLAIDAAGDLYTVSGTTLTLITPAGAKATLYSALGNGNGAALDSAGNIYIADAGLGGYDLLARTAGFYKFLTSSGSIGITLSSIGTTAVSTTAYTATNTTDFTVTASTTNGCSGVLAAGTFCGLNANYSQVVPGIPTDVLSFTAPVANGTPTFTLTAASSAPAITVTAAPSSVAFGGSVTLKATVYGAGNTGGTVTFYSSGTKITTATSDANATATVTYTPTAVGNYSITADYTPVGASSASVTTATAATFTVTQATPTISLTVSPTTGFATTTYTGTATVSSTAGTPTGTVTFKNGTTTVGTGTLTNGVATATFTNLAVGTNCVTAVYGGATNYATVTSTCTNVTVVTAVTPTITLSVTPTTAYTNTTITATATATSTVGVPSGTITFYNGTTVLGTGTLNTSGVATATFSGLPVGTDCITAVYTATTNFTTATSACANVVVSAAFSVTPATNKLSFQSNYQQAQTQLTIVTGGRTDTLTFACTGLPAKAGCNFSPSSVTLAGGNATVQVQMLVANSGATYGSLFTKTNLTLAFAPFAGLALFGLRRRKRLATLLFALVALLTTASLTGCSGQDPTTLQIPSGSYNFNVTVSSGSTVVQTLPFTLNVP